MLFFDRQVGEWNYERTESKVSRDYLTAMRAYNAFKCIDIIALIRQYDARSKGIGSGASSNDGDLLKELVFKIMH